MVAYATSLSNMAFEKWFFNSGELSVPQHAQQFTAHESTGRGECVSVSIKAQAQEVADLRIWLSFPENHDREPR